MQDSFQNSTKTSLQHQALLEQAHRPIIWSIAGSDCSGGAGIQADIKTANLIGCEICTIITANTVQNSKQLTAIHPVTTPILQQQFDALIEDRPPSAIKVGLIANNEQLNWLYQTIKNIKQRLPSCPVIYDPVIKATVGQDLQTEQLSPQVLQNLLPLIDVITPNIDEAGLLIYPTETTTSRYQSASQPAELAKKLFSAGAQSVLITGGHAANTAYVTDYCFSRSAITSPLILQSPRIDTHLSHGSGCSFATAISSFLAQGYLLRDAFMQAKAFINKSFYLSQQAEQLTKAQQGQADKDPYYGSIVQSQWPVEKQFYPEVKLSSGEKNHPQNVSKNHAYPSCETDKLGLYPVIDSLAWLEKLLPMGLKIIQLRIKNKPHKELENIIQQAVKMTKPYGTRLFINDHWQLAIKHKAYGVHLGQEDLASANLQAIQQAGLRLGISTHGCYEFKLAEQLQPTYLAIGAIFPTSTKDMTGQIQGLKNLQQILNIQSSNIPVVAIGGINLARAPDVLKAGVKSIAVVTAITQADNTEKTIAEWQSLFR